MSAITRVEQKEPFGCGIACAAMLASASYDQAKAKSIDMGLGQAGTNYGLRPIEVIRIAESLGANVQDGVAPFPVKIRRGDRWHFIVVGINGEIYDPA